MADRDRRGAPQHRRRAADAATDPTPYPCRAARRSLERIAEENRRLYSEQRTIAQTLQHALLPEALPKIQGVETGARYEAGVEGVDIGGDWYDLIALDDHRLLLVVGDVSGRGVRAAATMASLRYAIHAYAAQNDPPATILTKLSKLVNVGSDRPARHDPVRARRRRSPRADGDERGPPAAAADQRRQGNLHPWCGGRPDRRQRRCHLHLDRRVELRAPRLCLHSPTVWWSDGARASTPAGAPATGRHRQPLRPRRPAEPVARGAAARRGDDDTAIAGLRWLD